MTDVRPIASNEERLATPRNLPRVLCPGWTEAAGLATGAIDLAVATGACVLALSFIAPPAGIIALLVSARLALFAVSAIELRGGRAVRERWWEHVDRLDPEEAGLVRTMVAQLDRSIDFARSTRRSPRLEAELQRAMHMVLTATLEVRPATAAAQLRAAAATVHQLRGIAFHDALASTDASRRAVAASIDELQVVTAALHAARAEVSRIGEAA